MQRGRGLSFREPATAVGLAFLLGVGIVTLARGEQPNVAASPGMDIYRDPATGKLGAPPPEVVPPAPRAVPATPPVVLPETRGRTRAGGVKADLQGRFDSPMSATVGADGKVHVECGHPAADGKE